MKKILIVGAGLTGAVTARELAESGKWSIDMIEQRGHIGGNCHTERCAETGIMQHVYGPHIFHTNNKETWEYVNRFAVFHPFVNRVMATTNRGVFGMPINLLTINQFFGTELLPAEARAFIAARCVRYDRGPNNFEEQALATIGPELYEAFFQSYTMKQWGCAPNELSAAIFKRIPLRYTYDDNYFPDAYQGIPEEGYTEMIRRMTDHKNISVAVNTPFTPHHLNGYDLIVFTGAIDEYFDFRFGRLSYRTVYFTKHVADDVYLGNGVMNYCDARAHTRIHEHKFFSPWESHTRTVYFMEFSRETEKDDIPFYPKRLAGDLALYRKYADAAESLLPRIRFAGRLGTYRYVSMHEVVDGAIALSRDILGKTDAL